MFGQPKSAKYLSDGQGEVKKTFFFPGESECEFDVKKNLVEPLTIRYASEESRNLP